MDKDGDQALVAAVARRHLRKLHRAALVLQV